MRNGYIGTGSIDAMQATFTCSAFYKRRNAVRGENDRSFRHLIQDTYSIRAIECDHSQAREFFNRMTIMNNLSDDIDGSRVSRIFRYLTDRLQCINYTIAVTTGRNSNDFHVFPHEVKMTEGAHIISRTQQPYSLYHFILKYALAPSSLTFGGHQGYRGRRRAINQPVLQSR